MTPTQTWPPAFAERYREAGYWTGDTLPAMLARTVARYDSRLAVIDGEQRWSYRELEERAAEMARGFRALGLQPGERVIVQLPNIAGFFSVVFGLFRARLLPVFTLPAHRRVEIEHFARKADARAYVGPGVFGGFDYGAMADAIAADTPSLAFRLTVGSDARIASFADASAVAGLDDLPSPSDVAFLQLSGGSTGLSKLIPRTHDDYIYSFRASNDICGITETSVYLAALPLAHNFTMSSPGTLGLIHAGGTVVVSPSPAPDVAFKLIARERVTITAVVPPLALLWLDAAPSSPHDRSSLQVLQVGGAKLATEVARRVRPTLGCTLQQVFGMAEGLVNYTRLDDDESTIVSTQGRPISPDDELRIVDDEDRDVVTGGIGQLLTRGPYTIRTYFNDDEANRRAFTADGYYRTGDMVRRRADGYLEVHGRVHDHINRGGEKVSAEEIEGHLLAHPQVHDAVVVAIPDPHLGERACAYVIARGEAPTTVALKGWLRQRGIAAYKIPDRVEFVSAFPETGVGKVSRKDLRAALRAAAPAVPSKEGA